MLSKSYVGRCLIDGSAQGRLLYADAGLSFWGGVDSLTGEIIDQHHPLVGNWLTGCVLAIPSGRGSCTGSSVMMELISSGRAPVALVFAEVDEILDEKIDLVSLGNPRFSLSEFERLAQLTRGLRKRNDTKVVVTCGRAIFEQARKSGYISVIEEFGATIINDTCWCMLNEPVVPPNSKTLMTNSGKFAHYGPRLVGRSVHFGSLAACVDPAVLGHNIGGLPSWLK